jgi:hypothetical protein
LIHTGAACRHHFLSHWVDPRWGLALRHPSPENQTMDHSSNPFARGYYGFEIRRLAVISYDERHPQTFLPLHPSQAHLPDEKVAYQACIFNDDFGV